MRWNVVGCAMIVIFVAGCQRAVEPVYVSRAEVLALSPELQQAIQAELVKYCGTPLHPKLIGDEKDQPSSISIVAPRCSNSVVPAVMERPAMATDPRPKPSIRARAITGGAFSNSPPRRTGPSRAARICCTPFAMAPAARRCRNSSCCPSEDLQAVVDHVLVLTHRGELEFLLALEADDDDSIDPEKTPELIESIVGQWKKARHEIVTPITQETAYDEASIERGKKAFLTETAGCFKCHGPDGRGLTVEKGRSLQRLLGISHASRRSDGRHVSWRGPAAWTSTGGFIPASTALPCPGLASSWPASLRRFGTWCITSSTCRVRGGAKSNLPSGTGSRACPDRPPRTRSTSGETERGAGG